MLNYFVWSIVSYWSYRILKNDSLWVQVIYHWTQTSGEFFLHLVLDTNHNTSYYLAFDDIWQLDFFHKLLKISWIWPKTACFISTSYTSSEIRNAIEQADLKFFRSVPWIWPKTAKKIIIELKDKISLADIDNMEKLDSHKQRILSWIVSLGYSKEKVKDALKNYDWDLSNVQQSIKDIISNI